MVEGTQGELEYEDDRSERRKLTEAELQEVADKVRPIPPDRNELGQADEAKRRDIRDRAAAILEGLGDYYAGVNTGVSEARRDQTSEKLKDPVAEVDAALARESAAQKEHDRRAAEVRTQRAEARRPQQEINRQGHDAAVEALREAARRRTEVEQGQQDAG